MSQWDPIDNADDDDDDDEEEKHLYAAIVNEAKRCVIYLF